MKHFKNNKKVTVQSLLKTYQKFNWQHYPSYTYNRQNALKLIGECDESDQYTNWKQELQVLETQHRELKRDIDDIVGHQMEIKLRNSVEEYNVVLKRLRGQLSELSSKIHSKKSSAPKSKYDLLKKLYEWMEIGKKQAENQLIQRQKYNNSRCRCDGYRCEC